LYNLDDFFGDNPYSREFAITENLYSLDGIRVYDQEDLSLTNLGAGNTGVDEGNFLLTRYMIFRRNFNCWPRNCHKQSI